MSRPRIAPDALAALVAAVPARAAKKLDASPQVADTWTWRAGASLQIDTGTETVTLPTDAVLAAHNVSCTCLLSPRCFHVLAVVTLLPVAEAADRHELPAEAAVPTSELSESQRSVAAEAARVAGAVLESGLLQTSTLRMGELLRVVHACRLAALPRLEAASLAVFEAARDLRERTPTFRLADAAARIAEMLLVAERLQHHADPTWVGIARRSYQPRSGLRLAGIASAPVLRSGYAGVISYFTDGERIYSAQELLPGDASRARDAYGAQLRFGEISLSHRKAVHQGLLFARAEVSAEGRLGAGKDVVCATIPREAALVDRWFDESIAAQLDRAEHGEHAGLVFARGTVATDSGHYALVLADGSALPLNVPIDDLRFATRDNLAQLAAAAPTLHLVARLGDDGITLDPLAVGLDQSWFSLPYDALKKGQLANASAPIAWTRAAMPSVLDPLRRRVLRMALAGTRSLPAAALPELAREAHHLREALLFTAAAALDALAASLHAPTRTWLALHVYLQASERSLARAAHRT